MDPAEFMVERTDTQAMNDRLFCCEGTPNTRVSSMLSSVWMQIQVGLIAPQGEETTGREACPGTQMSEVNLGQPDTNGQHWEINEGPAGGRVWPTCFLSSHKLEFNDRFGASDTCQVMPFSK